MYLPPWAFEQLHVDTGLTAVNVCVEEGDVGWPTAAKAPVVCCVITPAVWLVQGLVVEAQETLQFSAHAKAQT